MFVLVVFSAFVLVRSESRLEANIKMHQERECVHQSKLLAEIKRSAPNTRWIYVQSGMEQYAFEAKLPMPPEIAVVALKRFWSGQITTEQIIQTCQRYKPEELLLSSNYPIASLKMLLTDYTNTWQRTNFMFYVRK